MSIPNTTYRIFVEKLGNTNSEEFVGDAGEIFYDPNNPELFLSDGSTIGGLSVRGTDFNPYTEDDNGRLIVEELYYKEDDGEGSADFVDDGIALTRANQYGLFNALHDFQSPAGTLWNSEGIDNLENVNQRKFITFFAAANGKLGINVLNRNFIMHDTINDKYYTVVFTSWSGGNQGGFAYTRQQINSVTGASIGAPVSFTKTNGGSEVDNIDTGLSITRASNGGIYNPESEGGWDNTAPDTPYGTEWNSQGWQDLSDITIREYGNLYDVVGRFGYMTGQELIMHDTINDKYYLFKFDTWRTGANGGAFSYHRSLVNPTIFFNRPDSDDSDIETDFVDNLAPGIRIARGNGGFIYNIEEEDGWDWDESPVGLRFNAEGWDDLTNVVERQYTSFGSFYKNATGKVITNYDFVVHDTINDEYWTLKFTRWQVGNNYSSFDYPGFSYVRRKLKVNQEKTGVIFSDGTVQHSAITRKDIGTLPQRKVDTAQCWLSSKDIGRHLLVTSSDNSNIGIPDSCKVNFPIGSTITIINRSGDPVTIYMENDEDNGTIYGAGTLSNSSSWQLPDNGGGNIATLTKIKDYVDGGDRYVEWLLSGIDISTGIP